MTTMVLRQRWLVYLIRALLLVPLAVFGVIGAVMWQFKNAATTVGESCDAIVKGLLKFWPEHS